ncbi:MAG: response regulator transcription factor [Bacteroidetes bacterium]|nr:response regulator transcription factor [Bacteroidota bacterium]
MNTPITIIIADDHSLFAEGLSTLLKDEKDMNVLAIVSNGRALIDAVRNQQPHLVLLDINMPLLNGLDAMKRIKQEYPKVKILMLSTYGEEHLIEAAKSNGANGYLLKNTNKEELLQVIRLIAAGQSSFPYRLSPVINSFEKDDNFLKKFNFSRREFQLLGFIKQGFTNAQIAEAVHLSIYTVETHRKNIMHKLNLNSPTALMKFILENGL